MCDGNEDGYRYPWKDSAQVSGVDTGCLVNAQPQADFYRDVRPVPAWPWRAFRHFVRGCHARDPARAIQTRTSTP